MGWKGRTDTAWEGGLLGLLADFEKKREYKKKKKESWEVSRGYTKGLKEILCCKSSSKKQVENGGRQKSLPSVTLEGGETHHVG